MVINGDSYISYNNGDQENHHESPVTNHNQPLIAINHH